MSQDDEDPTTGMNREQRRRHVASERSRDTFRALASIVAAVEHSDARAVALAPWRLRSTPAPQTSEERERALAKAEEKRARRRERNRRPLCDDEPITCSCCDAHTVEKEGDLCYICKGER